jgi:starch synthase (maltosyl-transferring)
MLNETLPWRRAIIESVTPQVDGGRFAAKRVVGDTVVVEADAFTDGHDRVRVRLAWRHEDDAGDAGEVEMTDLGNDRWRGTFVVGRLGRYRFDVIAWVDAFRTWRHDFKRREDPADIAVALQSGALLAREAASRADGADRARLEALAGQLAADGVRPVELEPGRTVALSDELGELMDRHADRRQAARLEQALPLVVEPIRARCSAWYEFFPRSAAPEPGRHGTFADCAARLPRVAEMGFDVVYFPPIHPIGRVRRKGPNNTLTPGPDDPGSPWAIGAKEGGHRDIHPELGTEAQFRDLVRQARALGLEIALDIAFQCAPDHPYVEAHPDWFRWRPDGTVQYAENPPKKYQDIYPFEFENADWRGLFEEMKGVVTHWIDCGVTIFRVDNPHTKPFAMWEWLIGDIRRTHPEAIFLSEAFTRPRVMHRLAKLGFSQSYTYFTWRNTRYELTEYLTELNHDRSREYFRPNLWPNTPDILPEALQVGGRPAFIARLVLAATMGANYGIYGPAFELVENVPVKPGSEEYLDSEKYQLRHRDLDAPHTLAPLITRVNAIRRENPALQRDWNIRFHPTDNDQIICYSKACEDGSGVILCAVNLDPHHVQSGWVDLPLSALGIRDQSSVQVHELLSDQRFLWSGDRHFLQLDPFRSPAQVFRPRQHVRSEQDFDYFL